MSTPTIRNYTAIHIAGDSITRERLAAESVFVLDWEAAGVVIPWPAGMTIKEAIIAWALDPAPTEGGQA